MALDTFNELMAGVMGQPPTHAERVATELYGPVEDCICGYTGRDLDGHILAALDGDDDPTAEPEHRAAR